VDWFHSGDVRMIRIIDTNYQLSTDRSTYRPCRHHASLAGLALMMATVNGHDSRITATGSDHSASGCFPENAQAPPANENGAPDHRVHDQVSGIRPSDVIGRRHIVLLPHGPAEQLDLPHPRSEGPSA
jgi:hypothetical protein